MSTPWDKTSKFDDYYFPLWFYGEVVSIDDPAQLGRIKVVIDGIDQDVPERKFLDSPEDGGLPWCRPLMPKFINVVPKVGELVKVAVFDYRNKKARREYVGPVIAEQLPQEFQKSDANTTKMKIEIQDLRDGAGGTPGLGARFANDGRSDQLVYDLRLRKAGNQLLRYPSTNEGIVNLSTIDFGFGGEKYVNIWSTYPKKEDIAIIGRKNTDIILRDNTQYDEIILRAGKIEGNSLRPVQINRNATSGNIGEVGFDESYGNFIAQPASVANLGELRNSPLPSPVFLTKINRNNPGYITINYTFIEGTATTTPISRSHVNVVADRVNLISHKGSEKKGTVSPILNGNLSEQESAENNKLHPLVYGDVLWEYMGLLGKFILNHIHQGSNLPPDQDTDFVKLANWYNDNMGIAVDPNKAAEGGCTFLSKGVKTN